LLTDLADGIAHLTQKKKEIDEVVSELLKRMSEDKKLIWFISLVSGTYIDIFSASLNGRLMSRANVSRSARRSPILSLSKKFAAALLPLQSTSNRISLLDDIPTPVITP
jgi:hypothetical protein